MTEITPAFDLGNTPGSTPAPDVSQQEQLLTAMGIAATPLRSFLRANPAMPADELAGQALSARQYLGAASAPVYFGPQHIFAGSSGNGFRPELPGTYVIPLDMYDTPVIYLATEGFMGPVTIVNDSGYDFQVYDLNENNLTFVIRGGTTAQFVFATGAWTSVDTNWTLAYGNVQVTRQSDTELVLTMTGSDAVTRSATITLSAPTPPPPAGRVVVDGLDGPGCAVYTTLGFVNVNGSVVDLLSPSYPSSFTMFSSDESGAPAGDFTYISFTAASFNSVVIDGLVIPYGGGSPECIVMSYGTFGTATLSNGNAPCVLMQFATIVTFSLSNFGIGYSLDIQNMGFDQTAINSIFNGLAAPPAYRAATRPAIYIAGNPGEVDCDYSIAVGKGYDVYSAYWYGENPL